MGVTRRTGEGANDLEQGEHDEAASGGRPRETARPAFDPSTYAEETEGRERLPTIVDEVATEQARLASVLMDSSPPPAPKPAPHRGTGTLPSMTAVTREDAEELAMLRARLAPMSRVPALARKLTELGTLIEDPKTAFVLGFVDGLLPLETIVEVAGLPELDTLRILERAVDQYVLTFSRLDG